MKSANYFRFSKKSTVQKWCTMLIIFTFSSLMGLSQTAIQPAGSGTEADPYQIASLDNLYWLSQADTAWTDDHYYIQTADIDASSTSAWDVGDHDGDAGTTDEAMGFSPIGKSAARFRGSYNGQEYTINGLYINRPITDYIGFIGYATTSSNITNLGVTNVSITGDMYVGALVGYSSFNGNVSFCFSTGEIEGTSRVGGLIGKNYFNVSNCYSFANVTGGSSGSGVGGLIGWHDLKEINECYAKGTVNGGTYIGGLIGYNSKGAIKNSYSTGNIDGGSYSAGGLIGYYYGISDIYLIENCYSISKVTTSTSRKGGLIGYGNYPVKNSFWDIETSGLTTSSGSGAVGKTTTEMKTLSTYTLVTSDGLTEAWDYVGNLNDDSANEDIWVVSAHANNTGYLAFTWQDSLFAAAEIDAIEIQSTTTATGNGNITFLSNHNPTAHGICWNTSGEPTLTDNFTDEGAVSNVGTFNSDITGLTNGQTYFARTYVTNVFGTTYGNEIEFIAGKPIVATDSVSDITSNTAIGHGYIMSTGLSDITAYGFCWNTVGNPTIADDNSDEGATSTTGTFTTEITGLELGHTYYARMYVTNSEGTVYGDEINFNTYTEPNGSGTESDPYQIKSLSNLCWMSNNPNSWDKYFIQTANIDASETSTWNIGDHDEDGGTTPDEAMGFLPIGNIDNKFEGTYDGQGFTINSLYINRPALNNTGLFGYLLYGTISNIGIKNADIKGRSYVGALIGYVYLSEVVNCYNSGNIQGVANYSYAGGLFGFMQSSNVNNCYSSANVSAYSYAGGLVGQSVNSTLENSYTTGNVNVTFQIAGGFVGRNASNSIIENCYATGDITSLASASSATILGGFAGYGLSGHQITNCYSLGSTNTGSQRGGFIGRDDGGTVENCFWNTETSGMAISAGGTGKTTAEMQSSGTYTSTATTGLTNAWDFLGTPYDDVETVDIWSISAAFNDGYPSFSGKATGTGTSADPYVIVNLLNLYWLSQTDTVWDKNFIQTANIDASETYNWDSGSGFTPIGNGSTSFTGSYYGKGHLIDSLFINRPVTDYVGLFGRTQSGSYIDSLGVNRANITGQSYVGGLIGATTTSEQYSVYSNGSIEGVVKAGGLIGNFSNGTLSNAYASGSVTNNSGNGNIGGLVGAVFGGTIDKSYSTCLITGSGSNVGGLIGYNSGGTISNSFWDTETSVTTTSAAGTGKTNSEMQIPCMYIDAGWDLILESTDEIWGMNPSENDGYLFLGWQGFDHNKSCSPIDQAKDLIFTEGTTSANIQWTNGTGSRRVVLMSATTTGEPTVADKTTYTANTTFGSGTEAGAGWYSVYNGTGTAVTVNNLTPGLSYRVMVLEYNSTAGDERYNSTTSASNPLNFTQNKLDQSITLASSAIKIYGDADFDAGATASSGLTVTYESSNTSVATITGSTITIIGAGTTTITASQAGNSSYNAAADVEQTLTVTKKELTIIGSYTIKNKVYDSDVSASFATQSTSLLGKIAGDQVLVGGFVLEFASENVGSGIMVSIASASLSGTEAGNYTLSLTGAPTATADILARELTIDGSFTANSKTYNADVNAVIATNSLSLTNTIGGEDVSLTNEVAEFADKNVGTAKTVSIASAGLTGSDAGNYTLSLTGAPTTTADIGTKALAISGVIADNKVYDGSTTAALSGTATLSGIIAASGDDISLDESSVSATFANANVGSDISVSVSGYALSGTDASNYILNDLTGLSADITAKEVTIGGTFLVYKKTYDGDIAATMATNSLSLVGNESGDDVSLSNIEIEFASSDVAIGIGVSIVSADLAGTDASNYTLSLDGAPTSSSDIQVRELTISGSFIAENKTYNADVNASIATNSLSLTNTIEGEDVSLTNEVAEFADKNVGTGKTVSIASAGLTGSDAGNYTISLTGAPTTTADIETKALAISGVTADNKVYDGSTTAALSGTATLSGIIAASGDDVSLDESSVSATFTNANVGTDIEVGVSGYTITGTDASNYNLNDLTGLLANIIAMPVTVSANASQTRVYGESDPELTYTASDLLNADTYSGILNRETGNDVGTYAINQGTLTAGSNYAITFIPADFTITQQAIMVTADASQSKVYGDTDPVFTYTATALSYSDSFSGTLSREAGEDVGAYAINQGTLTAGSNYALTFTPADFNITAKPINVVADAGQTKVYGEADPAAFTYTADNLLNSDTFAGALTRDAGEDAGTYNITQGTLAASSNYSLNYTGNVFTITKANQIIGITEIPEKDLAADALTFDVEASTTSGLDLTYSIVSGPATISGATITLNGNTGTVVVQASQAGNNNYNEATATKSFNVIDNSLETQTITFDALADKTYGDASFSLTATASSDLAVSYIVISGPVTISGSEVTITGTGEAVIEANQSGNETYNPAPAVQQTFTVGKANLTVTADDKSKVYGEANPELTFAYSGFVYSEDATVLTAESTISTEADENSDAGTYAITVSGGSADNYTFDYVAGTLTVTKADQTISIDAIADVDVSVGTVNITASTTSGLDLSYTITSGPATIEGSTITLTGTTGMVELEVSQAGSNNYNAATANTSFMVSDSSKTNQTITFEAIADKTYGDAVFNVSASASSGLNVNLVVLSGPATISNNLVAISGVGEVVIEASQAGNDEYNTAENVQQSFNVQKATLTATADDKAKVYGEANPELTITYTGFVNNDAADVLDEAPVASTEADATSDAGTYAITLNSVTDNNYEVASVNAELLISKALLSVSVDDYSKVEGEVNPEFELIYSGFVNGDEASVIDELPVATCSADVNSEADQYEIVVSGGLDNNYKFEFTNGTLTVTPFVGINQFASFKLEVYPNPTVHTININNAQNIEITSLSIYSTNGELVYSDESGQQSVDVNYLQQGTYILTINNLHKTLFIKE